VEDDPRSGFARSFMDYSGWPRRKFHSAVDVHVAALRRKLEPNPRAPQYILTLHGLSYRFIG